MKTASLISLKQKVNKNPVAPAALPVRLRRLRQSALWRSLVQETRISKDQLMLPIFVRHGHENKLSSRLPNHPQRSLSDLLRYLEGFVRKGGRNIILFGIPQKKDAVAGEAYSPDGIVQQALVAITKAFGSDLLKAADLCFCEYTDHGHCGILKKNSSQFPVLSSGQNPKPGTHHPCAYDVDNDATLELAAKTAVSLAGAGADLVAPSGMMDGQVAAIRGGLDRQDFKNTPILAYSAKYSSTLYGPFRELAQSTPSFGDRKSYQMNSANTDEALREIALDIEEGADIVMVKPALFYLDIIRRAKEKFSHPLAAFQVSAEAWMVEQYAASGMAKRADVIIESTLAIRRAGADCVISYFTDELLDLL